MAPVSRTPQTIVNIAMRKPYVNGSAITAKATWPILCVGVTRPERSRSRATGATYWLAGWLAGRAGGHV